MAAASVPLPAKAQADKKRVFIYVPFKEVEPEKADDFDDPHFCADHWAKIRNLDPGKSASKFYMPVHGPDEFRKIAFRPDDRIYVHARGTDRGELFAKKGKPAGHEVEGVDKHTPASLLASMDANQSFAMLGRSESFPLDLRIAASHSAERGGFNERMSALLKDRHVNLKGKIGEFSGNTGSIDNDGVCRPSSKGLVAPVTPEREKA